MSEHALFWVLVLAAATTTTLGAFEELTHRDASDIISSDAIDQEGDAETCSDFVQSLLATSKWRSDGDDWREAGLQLIEYLVASNSWQDSDDRLSLRAEAKLVSCYEVLKQQVDRVGAIKHAYFAAIDNPSTIDQEARGPDNTASTSSARPSTAPHRDSKARKKYLLLDKARKMALERIFALDSKPPVATIERLARDMRLDKEFLLKWFSNKRYYLQRRQQFRE